jgi:hypothetical protein
MLSILYSLQSYFPPETLKQELSDTFDRVSDMCSPRLSIRADIAPKSSSLMVTHFVFATCFQSEPIFRRTS